MTEKSLAQKNQLPSPEVLAAVLLKGDLSKLTPEQKTQYYMKVCESVGLNPLTKPLAYMEFRTGSQVLYATKDATDQLRQKHSVSIYKMESKTVEGVHIVTAYARLPDGREDVSTGAVNITNLKGDALANALLKCETKSKRRVTLSIVGLGMLDETELETIPDAKPVQEPNPVSLKPEVMPRSVEESMIQQMDADQGEFVFNFGQYEGRSISSVPTEKLSNYLSWLKKQNNPGPMIKDAISAIQLHISHPQNGAQP